VNILDENILLPHPEFDTKAKRMGTVIRISRRGLSVWRLHAEEETFVDWPEYRWWYEERRR
jgi:hypothetical protein